ncbi:hypothetical protein OSB04_002001 [Centaurea solstitialis]|uniref:Reverse transcriptase domain-containing protein n=1 Tax=Centaurea solstitialis TaxID=347529 RepID=A0AA38U3S5_9ASTR|nr:hypothetical protein OSB04_002001 [Centaurea solstitialis]
MLRSRKNSMASTSAVEPSSTMEETRNWLEMPREIMGGMILQRLNVVEILTSVQKVCTTWRRICKDPAMWKVIDMHHCFDARYDIEKLTKQAVSRSHGELIDITLDGFVTDNLLGYILHSSKLNSLRLTNASMITGLGLILALTGLPHLETLQLYGIIIVTPEHIKVMGQICPQLKSFKMKIRFTGCDVAYATAIANSMPALCHLQLVGIAITNNILQVILHGCLHLESLDLHHCFYLNLDGNLMNDYDWVVCCVRISWFIKSWERRSVEGKEAALINLKAQASSLDLKAESSGLSSEEMQARMLDLKILDLEKSTNLNLKQRCRLKWAVSGDENSKLFHRVINNNRRRNFIHGISVNGVWSTDPVLIKETAFDYFSRKFDCNSVNRPSFRSTKFKVLSDTQRSFLEDEILELEVKNAVWDCGGDKSPGPDGYTFEFLKSFWSVIKSDLLKAIHHFELNAYIDPGCNSSFISLIPKMTFAEYRPISLIGCFYKVVAKILSNRLKNVIDSIIGREQTAFIKNRNILDGPLIISEIISWAKASKRKTMILKVDFEKAFDSLSWEFMDDILGQMGFGLKWRSWIKGCLNSASMSVLINGSPTAEFLPKKGVRQGDPLAPFLFIIAAEGLNVAMQEAKEKGVFHGVKLPNNGPILSNLHYADDAIFVGEWSSSNACNLARILRCFHLSSGLKVNFRKSSIVGIGVNDSEISSLAYLLNCKVGSLPLTYLGLPIGARMNKAELWGPVINKFLNKLSNWKSSLLSFGGRLTLCKSVLSNLSLYYFSLFKAPANILKSLESTRSKFFWGRKDNEKKITWIAWSKIIASKERGGLGIGSLKAQNLALLCKWWWCFSSENISLWKHVIQSLHGSDGGIGSSRKFGNFPGIWRSILKIQEGMNEANLRLDSLFQYPSISAMLDRKECSWALDPSGQFSVASLR